MVQKDRIQKTKDLQCTVKAVAVKIQSSVQSFSLDFSGRINKDSEIGERNDRVRAFAALSQIVRLQTLSMVVSTADLSLGQKQAQSSHG